MIRIRIKRVHISMRHKRILSFVTALVLLCAPIPPSMFALGDGPGEYLCGHVHDETCGWAEGCEGSPCMHEHDENCYTDAHHCQHSCDHVCTHTCDDACVLQELTCPHVCGPECTVSVHRCAHVCGEECTEVCTHVCGEECYAQENQCTHAHDADCYTTVPHCTHVHDASCGGLCEHVCSEECYVRELSCPHVHDESCGYVETVSPVPCGHVCEIMSFERHTPGVAIDSYAAGAGDSASRISSALPDTLLGTLACTGGSVEIPVRWNAAGYHGEAGTYVFRAVLTGAHCVYAAADNPETQDVDESEMPFIAVIVPEAESEAEADAASEIPPVPSSDIPSLPTPEPSAEPNAEPTATPTAEPTEEPVCGCTERCGEDCANPDCPVCAGHPENCAGRIIGEAFPQTGRVNAEGAEAEVDGLMQPVAIDTALTLYNELDGRYEFSSVEIATGYIAKELVTLDTAEQVCCCTEPCGADCVNADCPVCAELGWGACAIKLMSAQTLSVTAEDGSTVAVSGELPAGVTLSVTAVAIETAAEFVEENATILFAYDIKLFVAGVEWQPAPESPLTVTVTPPEPIETPVTVTHVREDAETGTTTPESVSGVTTTTDGTVEFPAEGFSIYIGTVVAGDRVTLTPGSGYRFFSDSSCALEISGEYQIADAATIYIKAEDGCRILNVAVAGVDGSVGTAVVVQGDPETDVFHYSIAFSGEDTVDQLIIVTVETYAPGGTITGSSTTIDVAAMFDVTAAPNAESSYPGSDNTDNVMVTGSGGVFTVTLKNDILLRGTIVISGATLTVLSAGSHMIHRDTANMPLNDSMFLVSGGNLSLGSGGISGNTITYHFNDNSDETYAVGASPPVSTETRYVTYTTVNAHASSTMAGSLTVDGGSASHSDSTGNMVVLSGGTVSLWGGVTLQNNRTYGVDTAGGVAVKATSGVVYLCGGSIRNCENSATRWASDGDGGALMLNGSGVTAYMYAGSITGCFASNSSAISLWNGSKLHLLGGSIHGNTADGDLDYPAQAVSVYNNSILYMYGGTVSGNPGSCEPADIRISTTGSNVLHLFGGTVGSLGSNSADNEINIYNGQVIVTMGIMRGDPLNGTVNYYGGRQYVVTMPAAVNADGGQIVNVTVRKGTETPKTFETQGMGTADEPNQDLSLLLNAGNYTITVESLSMLKTYTVSVDDADINAEMTGRSMTKPGILSQTYNTVALKPAGTGNDGVDGEIRYGYATTPDGTPSHWQTSNSFTLPSGSYYFYVKALAAGSLDESVSEEYQIATLGIEPTIDIGNNMTLSPGGVYTITPVVTPEGYPLDNIIWSIIGNNSPDTRIVKNNDGSGTVTIAVDETADKNLIVEARLSDAHDAVTVAIVVGGIGSASITYARPEAGQTFTAVLMGGSGIPSYQWQMKNAGSSTWYGVSTAQTYVPTPADVGKSLRVIITDAGAGENISAAVAIRINTVTFTVTIPESVNATSTAQFDIAGQLDGFLTGQRVDVRVSSANGFILLLSEGGARNPIAYRLYKDVAKLHPVASGDTIAAFTENGPSNALVYYGIPGTPSFSGTYTDTLTFTVIFNSGS